ncbi:MAG: type 4a pilus biogenesis protein PilO [Patescibacteria group bacterium]
MKGQRSQLFALFLLILLVTGGIFFLKPLGVQVDDNRALLDTASAELQGLQAEYDDLKALADEVAKSEAKRDELLSAVPAGYDEDGLILEITGMATEAGFTVNAMNMALGNDQELGKTITVTANFEGTYEDLIGFLQKVENADRAFNVETINVQLTSTTEVVFNLSIEAYYQ